MKKEKINKKDTFAEAMQKNPEAAAAFSEAGMHCIGCPYAGFESIEQGAAVHGIDSDAILKKINKNKAKSKKKKTKKKR